MFFKKKKTMQSIEGLSVPQHLAIIPDGNGRWAKKRGMPRKVGHREGAIVLKNMAKYCNSIGIKYLTVYAFSTENWKRPEDEVNALMDLFADSLADKENELTDSNIVVNIIGRKDRLSESLLKSIDNMERNSSVNTGLQLNIAIDYGSRYEIIEAVNSFVKKGEEVTEEIFSNSLMTEGIPDPELLIRTSGERRISNYLLWQLAYTELWFTDVLWPDFSSKIIDRAIIDFNKRDRRYGGV